MKVGDLVVIATIGAAADGTPDGPWRAGVFRLERVLEDGRLRCFSYVDGGFVVVDAALVKPCPPNTRAAP